MRYVVWGAYALVWLGCGDDSSVGVVQDGTNPSGLELGDAAGETDTADTAREETGEMTPDAADEDGSPPEDGAQETVHDASEDGDASADDTVDAIDAIDAADAADAVDAIDAIDAIDGTADTADPLDTIDPGDSGEDTSDAGDTDPGDVVAPCPLYQTRCEGVCVPTQSDPSNCGGCDIACEADEVCSAGGCAGGCLSGLSACSGTCVDLMTNGDHCGNCGRACPDGQGCVTGNCRPSIGITPPNDCVDFPPIVVLPGADEICLGEQAQTSFTWAICACESISTTNEVTTDAYDSTLGPYEPGGTGGGIGLGGSFSATNKLRIGGTLWASSAAGTATGNDTDIAHELHVGGTYAAKNVTRIGRDAFVVGDVLSQGTLTIAGDLHQPSGRSVTGQVSYASRIEEPVAVPPPCRCGDDERVPVAAIVQTHATLNDNAAVGLASDVLVNPSAERHLALPCGRFYLAAIATSHKTTIIAQGRVALFIGGDIASSNELQITVAPGGELDVFVGGSLDVSNKLRLGSANHPALMRVYIGGSGELKLSNEALIGAYIYSAEGPLRTSNQIEVFGGLFAKSLDASNKLTIHYDRAILGIGRDCAPPPPGETCDSCVDCGNQACVDGACGACATSADCCSPLVCVEGQCLSLGIITE
jgi:hypothetical protein